ncbi:hypothetical protein B7463_g4546, partial [Scytalidium lignicola]
MADSPGNNVQAPLPRVTIQFCTQCKWMLRAAYFAQELLSTFNTALGEVALQPSTGGTFIVTLYHGSEASNAAGGPITIQRHLIWDRKAEGGFPETKELKRRIRDIIDPTRDLGHVDRHNKNNNNNKRQQQQQQEQQTQPQKRQSISTAATFSSATPPPPRSQASATTTATGGPPPSSTSNDFFPHAVRAAASAAHLADTPTSTPVLGASALAAREVIPEGAKGNGNGNRSGNDSKGGKNKESSPSLEDICEAEDICEDCG